MQIGLPWWIGAGEPERGLELASETGYDFVELSLDAPWPDGLDPTSLADRADGLGVGLGFHAPWRTQALAHPREPLAQAAREIAQDCLAIARAAGAGYIVFHADASGFRNYPREAVVEEGLKRAHASLQALARSAGEDLDVLVENTRTPLGTPEEMADFLDPIPHVGFCLDPGHAAIQAHADGTAGFEAGAWSLVDEAWGLTHLMDVVTNEEGVRDHLLPGAGEADLEAIVEASRRSGVDRVLVEAFYADADGSRPGEEDWQQARQLVEGLA